MPESYPEIASIKDTLGNFDSEFHSLNNDFNEFLNYVLSSDPYMLHNVRVKRGLVNFFPSFSNILFGTDTQARIDAIYKKIDDIASLTEREYC